MKAAIVIPAYNEGQVIAGVLRALPKRLPRIHKLFTVVVDDGSTDETARIAIRHKAQVVRHPINGGVGVAKMTAMAVARKLKVDVLITLDADGQHDPTEIPQLIAPILSKKADVVIGSRLLGHSSMPQLRQIGNRAMNRLLRLVWGIQTTDSQSGFRAYSERALATFKSLGSGFEVDTEILILAKQRGLIMTEVPIKTIYTDYSKSKGQSTINALITLIRLIVHTILG